MLETVLRAYKICKLEILNEISEGPVKLKNSFDFDVEFDKEGKIAFGTLSENVELIESQEQFHMNIEIKGVFQINGVKSSNDRKEAHLKIYDSLFPYAHQIISHLGLDCGIPDLNIPKHPMKLDSIHFGEKPGKKNGKIIEMKIEE